MSQEHLEQNFDNLLNAIEEQHATTHKQLDEIDAQEAQYEKRKKPLPEILYHVTTVQNSQKILREGIDPSKLILEDHDVVSLSDDIDFAIRVTKETQNSSGSNLVVLAIDTQFLSPSRIHNYLMKADPNCPNPLLRTEIHEVHYEANIPPDAIEVFKQEKKK